MSFVYKRTCINCKKMFTIKDWQFSGVRCKPCKRKRRDAAGSSPTEGK